MPYIYKSGLQFGINETNIHGGLNCVELTQAEYDELTYEQKHNGQVYFITDGNYDYIMVNDSVPIGAIQAYGGATAPSGWLICDGRAISRTEYYELFKVIGISYGEGDGTTTFNLPDLKGRVAIGASGNYILGNLGGEAAHTISQNEIPNYLIGFYPMAPAYHTSWNNGGLVGTSKSKLSDYNPTNPTATSGTVQYGYNISTNGGGAAHNNMQPYVVTNYIIKAKNLKATKGQTDLFYPIGAYFETSDINFNPNETWGGTWECIPTKNIIKSSGEKTITTAETYTLCSATLEPNTKYIIFGNVATNNGNSFTVICNLSISGTVVYQLGDVARTTTNAGQGVATWHYVETGDSSVTINCLSYGYYTTSHIERGKILAIPLNQSGNYKWHRTA